MHSDGNGNGNGNGNYYSVHFTREMTGEKSKRDDQPTNQQQQNDNNIKRQTGIIGSESERCGKWNEMK
jgi:hypothetical protein